MKTITGHFKIAIDGFSSCGKSSFAKLIAKDLGILYIDSGAMYRAVTFWAIQQNALINGNPNNELIIRNLDNIQISFRKNKEGEDARLYLNGTDREDEIRSMQVSSLVSPVSKIPEVRYNLVDLQRKLSENQSVVMDGRDIGTTVFPEAEVKIYMTASPETRAERRYKELLEKGTKVDFMEVLKNVIERDNIDQSREVSPLKPASDAIFLDNTKLTIKEQMDWFHENFKFLNS